MDRLKKKVKPKSKKDISDPKDFTHVRHIGPQNLDQLDTEGNNNETTSDQQSEDKDLGEIVKRMILSTEFQKVLRTIVREETRRALADERHTLLKELRTVDSLTNLHMSCAVSGDDKVSVQQSTIDCPTSDTKNITENSNGSQVLKATPNEIEQRTAEENSSPATQQKQMKDSSASSFLDQKNLPSVQKETAIQKAHLKPCSAIRRECLSRAVQAHIIPIVDSLDFNRSNLPEELIVAGHLTEEECAAIRDEKRTRKDRIRYVITRSKSRSLQDIEKFLELIEKQIPHVVIEIRKTFEKTLNSNKIHDSAFNKCALCLCYDNIDVKEAADILWSTESISDGFYKDIVDCSKPRGCQEYIWKKLIELCNDKLTVDKQDIYDPLFDLISRRGNFDFIVKPLKSRLAKIGQLDCDCHSIKFLKPNSLERASRESSGISATPRSSASDERHSSLSGEFTKQVYVDDGTVFKDSRLRFRKLGRQSSLTDDKTDETFPKQMLYQSASLEILRTITEENDRQFQTGKLLTSRRFQFHKSESDLKRKLQDDVYFSRQTKNMDSEGSASKRHGWTNKDVDDLKRDLSQ